MKEPSASEKAGHGRRGASGIKSLNKASHMSSDVDRAIKVPLNAAQECRQCKNWTKEGYFLEGRINGYVCDNCYSEHYKNAFPLADKSASISTMHAYSGTEPFESSAIKIYNLIKRWTVVVTIIGIIVCSFVGYFFIELKGRPVSFKDLEVGSARKKVEMVSSIGEDEFKQILESSFGAYCVHVGGNKGADRVLSMLRDEDFDIMGEVKLCNSSFKQYIVRVVNAYGIYDEKQREVILGMLFDIKPELRILDETIWGYHSIRIKSVDGYTAVFQYDKLSGHYYKK